MWTLIIRDRRSGGREMREDKMGERKERRARWDLERGRRGEWKGGERRGKEKRGEYGGEKESSNAVSSCKQLIIKSDIQNSFFRVLHELLKIKVNLKIK
jgi:hypothetical protein